MHVDLFIIREQPTQLLSIIPDRFSSLSFKQPFFFFFVICIIHLVASNWSSKPLVSLVS